MAFSGDCLGRATEGCTCDIDGEAGGNAEEPYPGDVSGIPDNGESTPVLLGTGVLLLAGGGKNDDCIEFL